MAKRLGLASKLCAMLGGAGLAISVCAPQVMAQATVPPPWTNANYANRYVCHELSVADIFTGVAKINPNGKGRYTAGTLNVALAPFTAALPGGNPAANFCSYTLSTAGSTYAVNSKGVGGEVLLWTALASNPGACPASGGSFTMTTSFVIRNNVTANNTSPRTDFTSDNFLGLSAVATPPFAILFDPGRGYCLK